MISESPVLRKYMPGIISGSFVIRMYILESLNLRLSYGCLRMCFYTSWQRFANMMSPDQMTMPARTVLKLCARTRSECPDIFLLDLISWRISGIIEPWSECLPERIEALGRSQKMVPPLSQRNVTRNKNNVCSFMRFSLKATCDSTLIYINFNPELG